MDDEKVLRATSAPAVARPSRPVETTRSGYGASFSFTFGEIV
ncbi:hypothetical protein H4W81_000072 [Nonomuraea africana]|uniref:Uncharacterized protein n=1 Tax=Nonomuraea africana TaxID=46171 RepID=A0ABR9K698_9ACTN|nr:hypothetical protein [Nonomuraea africana]